MHFGAIAFTALVVMIVLIRQRAPAHTTHRTMPLPSSWVPSQDIPTVPTPEAKVERAPPRTDFRSVSVLDRLLAAIRSGDREKVREALDALLAQIKPTPPIDPFTGKPYLYRREGAGFVVYSVGRDGLDGGGLQEENDALFRCGK